MRLQTTEPGRVWQHPTVLNGRPRSSSEPGAGCHCTGEPQMERAGELLAQVVHRPEPPASLGSVRVEQGAAFSREQHVWGPAVRGQPVGK